MNDLSRQATRLEAIEGSYDKWLLGAIIALTGIGVVMVASSSIALMSSPFYYLNRHLIFLAVGIVLAVVGGTTGCLAVSGTALGVLGAGVAVHLSAQLVRFRQAARRQGERRPGR